MAAPEQIAQSNRFAWKNDFSGAEALEFGMQGGSVFDFGGEKFARGQVGSSESVSFADLIDSREKVVALGGEHAFVEMRARAEDLGDFAFDELAGAGVFDLIANGDLAPSFENAANIAVCGMERYAAHGNDAAFGEGDIEKLRADLGVFEEKFVKVAEAEQQQRIFGQIAFNAAILGHHGSELGVAGHCAGNFNRKFLAVRSKFYPNGGSANRFVRSRAPCMMRSANRSNSVWR